ncbi:hypothetical protein LINGRAHAP2_LOCUS17707, partial [Linum grandiflorum]
MSYGVFEISKGPAENAEQVVKVFLNTNSRAVKRGTVQKKWIATLHSLPAGSLYADSWNRQKTDIGKADQPGEKWVEAWDIFKYIRGALDHYRHAHLRSMKALSRTKPNQVERILRSRRLGMLSYSVCSFYNDELVDAVRLDHSPAAYNKHEVVGACNGFFVLLSIQKYHQKG